MGLIVAGLLDSPKGARAIIEIKDTAVSVAPELSLKSQMLLTQRTPALPRLCLGPGERFVTWFSRFLPGT